VQTFLPFASFKRSAECLDMKRLGKQRVECLQVLNVFAGVRDGWGNHPITRMWSGYETALLAYTLTVCDTWTGRGYRDTVHGKVLQLAQPLSAPGGLDLDGVWRLPDELHTVRGLAAEGMLPPWFGWRAFHESHRSNLIRKDAEHYRPYFPDTPPDLEYVWPV